MQTGFNVESAVDGHMKRVLTRTMKTLCVICVHIKIFL